jgi:Domain of unknown function (DUF4157)
MAPEHFLEEPNHEHSANVRPANEVAEAFASERAGSVRPSAVASAASVLHLQHSVGNAGTAAYLQRELAPSEEASDHSSPVHETIGSGGSPLDPGTRSTMEQSLGSDFGSVRLHVDAKSAESVKAAAYTVGEDIVVHPNHFTPGSPQAQRTLAHELTHVVQQRSGPVAGTPQAGGIQVSDPSDRFEQEAERTAEAVTSNLQRSTAEQHTDEGESEEY